MSDTQNPYHRAWTQAAARAASGAAANGGFAPTGQNAATDASANGFAPSGKKHHHHHGGSESADMAVARSVLEKAIDRDIKKFEAAAQKTSNSTTKDAIAAFAEVDGDGPQVDHIFETDLTFRISSRRGDVSQNSDPTTRSFKFTCIDDPMKAFTPHNNAHTLDKQVAEGVQVDYSHLLKNVLIVYADVAAGGWSNATHPLAVRAHTPSAHFLNTQHASGGVPEHIFSVAGNRNRVPCGPASIAPKQIIDLSAYFKTQSYARFATMSLENLFGENEGQISVDAIGGVPVIRVDVNSDIFSLLASQSEKMKYDIVKEHAAQTARNNGVPSRWVNHVPFEWVMDAINVSKHVKSNIRYFDATVPLVFEAVPLTSNAASIEDTAGTTLSALENPAALEKFSNEYTDVCFTLHVGYILGNPFKQTRRSMPDPVPQKVTLSATAAAQLFEK